MLCVQSPCNISLSGVNEMSECIDFFLYICVINLVVSNMCLIKKDGYKSKV